MRGDYWNGNVQSLSLASHRWLDNAEHCQLAVRAKFQLFSRKRVIDSTLGLLRFEPHNISTTLPSQKYFNIRCTDVVMNIYIALCLVMLLQLCCFVFFFCLFSAHLFLLIEIFLGLHYSQNALCLRPVWPPKCVHLPLASTGS